MKKFFVPLSLVVMLLLMVSIFAGTNVLVTVKKGKVRAEHINQFREALIGDLVPRNYTGHPTDGAGSLGAYGSRFYQECVSAGNPSIGSIMMVHSYNDGGCPSGWMVCDGRTITKANYDGEHGSGSWDKYVKGSALENKYLPDFKNVYAVGAASTPQDGSKAITTVGYKGHTINVSHTHTVPDHVHQWFTHSSSDAAMQTAYFGGTQMVYQVMNHIGGGSAGIRELNLYYASAKNLVVGFYGFSTAYSSKQEYNKAAVTTTSSWGSAALNVQPLSQEVLHCMRVIECAPP